MCIFFQTKQGRFSHFYKYLHIDHQSKEIKGRFSHFHKYLHIGHHGRKKLKAMRIPQLNFSTNFSTHPKILLTQCEPPDDTEVNGIYILMTSAKVSIYF